MRIIVAYRRKGDKDWIITKFNEEPYDRWHLKEDLKIFDIKYIKTLN